MPKNDDGPEASEDFCLGRLYPSVLGEHFITHSHQQEFLLGDLYPNAAERAVCLAPFPYFGGYAERGASLPAFCVMPTGPGNIKLACLNKDLTVPGEFAVVLSEVAVADRLPLSCGMRRSA